MNYNEQVESFRKKIKEKLNFLSDSEIQDYLQNYDGKISIYGFDLEEEINKIQIYLSKKHSNYEALLKNIKNKQQNNGKISDINEANEDLISFDQKQEEQEINIKNTEIIQKLEQYVFQQKVISLNHQIDSGIKSVAKKLKESQQDWQEITNNNNNDNDNNEEYVIIFDKEENIADPLINYGTSQHTTLLKVIGYIFCDLLDFYVSDENKNFIVFSLKKSSNLKKIMENIQYFLIYIEEKPEYKI